MIRRYKSQDVPAIARIYHDAIYELASRDYNDQQVRAWAGALIDVEHWHKRCAVKQPFVNERDGNVVGFIELEPDGHIGCTFVDPAHERTGVMIEIMDAVKDEARKMKLEKLYAEVSLTGKAFFLANGFKFVRDNVAEINGAKLNNFVMEFLIHDD